VGAVVIHDGRVLLIRRGKEPLKGRWVVPGGTVELGETLEEAVAREVLEETGIEVRPRDVLLVFDRILKDEVGVQYHYVIVDYVCDYAGGRLRAGSDAQDAAFVAPEDLPSYDLPDKALELVQEAFRRVEDTACGRPSEGSRILK
jgi:ADP-ribose pyrophosphatase YjhB (NUDIX family)